jgi:hypothetical protein
VAGGLHFANKDHVRRKVNRLVGDISGNETVVSLNQCEVSRIILLKIMT